MAFNIRAAIDAAKNKGPDMTQAQAGGGDFEIAAEGFVRLRFVGYFETGKKESEWQGKKKVNDTAELMFECSGPKHQPREVDGVKYPIRVTERVKLSLNEKSNFFKLFAAMNWEGKATHIAELLGNDYVGRIEHNKKKIDGKDFTFVNIRDVRKPFATNPETGDEYRISVDAPITELKLFLWDFATPEMWDSIFIEGQYDERKNDKGEVTSPARSKNVLQEKIMKALNWKACPIYDYATKTVTKEDAAALDAAVGEVEDAPKAAPEADDPMEGVA